MQTQGYRVTLEHQAGHWWYRSRRELWLRQVERAARALGYPERRLALCDYGCAAGFDLASLARFGAAHGADTAEALDALAAPTNAAFPIHRVPDDLAALRGRFHVVTCLDVLEHLDDDVGGLRAITALLAPGGQLVATVPAYDWLWSGEDVISAHRRRYTRARLVDAARAAGFEYFELMATRPGEPFYAALGFAVVERVLVRLPGGVDVPFARMRRAIEG